MSNCAYLLATNTKEPSDTYSPTALVMRTANYVIPLLWFGCFRTLDVNRHVVSAIGSDGRPISFQAMTLFCKRSVAVTAFEEFAGRLLASRAISLPVVEHIKTMLSDLKCVDCYAFQLDCSELQMVIPPEEFDVWLSKGIEFAEKVACGAWSNIIVLDHVKTESLAHLFEFAHIYPQHAREHDHDYGDDDCGDSSDELVYGGALVKTAKAKATRQSVIWECANWQHSLIGIAAE